MGFLDKAKQAATDLASKADTALSNTGLGGPGADTERLFKDLGRLTFREATGESVDPAEKARLVAALQTAAQQGAAYTGGPPPPPGSNASAPPPPASGYGAPQPPPGQPQDQPRTPPPPPPPPPGSF